ncbi:MAG: hypothetical protein JWQ04_2611 [Pedosphaera sp.]|nr:hypothetical protein [Pedosphaera sp.]
MNAITEITPHSRMQQAEFALAVAVCAWCKPKPGAFTPSSDVLSHGICPRHLRNMRLKMQRKPKQGR